ncbi:LOW QUALITY PROTEIN: uncharacterized protein LOC111072225 [Drosophila obscura]|uniref:LOW QUALITY PROTEIN: uncharacterized protein LOC111072225 n=1 Tax=Drosophila obscura TaxID=7282 RepID=UPI001BB114B7|nr:LOW QUALITY PROTEIN: uncharacterized protein LOC111072225 [Drosophila obscura]
MHFVTLSQEMLVLGELNRSKPQEQPQEQPQPASHTTPSISASTRPIECSVRNLIRLFILTTTIMASGRAIGSGLVQANAVYEAVNRPVQGADPYGYVAPEQLDELLLDATVKLPARTTTAAALAAALAAAAGGEGGGATTATPSADHLLLTTWQDSYDSNEIDNSYAVAAAAAAAALPADGTSVAFKADVEPDYVIDMGQTSTTVAPSSQTVTTIFEQRLLGRSQDMESLSLQADGTGATATAKGPLSEAPSRKNSLSRDDMTFQQIGSQKINALMPATAATDSGGSAATNASNAPPTEPARNRTNNVRTSAVRVDGNSKHSLPKGQKTDAPMLNYIFDTFSAANKHHHHDQRYGPHFEDAQRLGQSTNLTVQAGSSIHLNCRISLLQDKTVSWVRHNTQDEENALDLLTVGMHTYTGDKRYKMEFQYPNNWRLKITNVKKDDEAIYECQISTHPPRLIQINLHVNAPKVMIVDEVGDPLQEKYYEIDSTLQLSCVVRNVAMTSSVVYWKHIDDVLNYDVTRGGVSVKTELMEDGANSTLSIAKISKTDSGNYTCSISEFQNFTIVVHILNGESFAELHHGGAGAVQATWQHLVALHFLMLILLAACRLRAEFR